MHTYIELFDRMISPQTSHWTHPSCMDVFRVSELTTNIVARRGPVLKLHNPNDLSGSMLTTKECQLSCDRRKNPIE